MFGAAAITAVIGGGGFAAGTGTAEPGQAASPPATTADSSRAARSGYADVVRAVLPSVVLIRTDSGLGSGVVLDGDVHGAEVMLAAGRGVRGEPEHRAPQRAQAADQDQAEPGVPGRE